MDMFLYMISNTNVFVTPCLVYIFNPTELTLRPLQASRLQLHALCVCYIHTLLEYLNSNDTRSGKLYISWLLSSLNSRSELQQNLAIPQSSFGSRMGRTNSSHWTQHSGEVQANPSIVASITHLDVLNPPARSRVVDSASHCCHR